MARQKYDGVIEAVHFKNDGDIDWVRAFLRRGPTWSDWILLNRDELVDQLKSGKHFITGTRIEYLGTTFKPIDSVNLIKTNHQNVIVTGERQSKVDRLDGVPIL